MLMEDDGKNRCQLDAAGLPDFVDRFVRERLYEKSVEGWPAENEVNSLAIWLLWLTATEGAFTFFLFSINPNVLARASQSRDTRTTCTDGQAHLAIRPHARPRKFVSATPPSLYLITF